ncbi:MAG TPA: DUF1223 domain-containing protein [Stellaceae bacterium]|nr:DUF1223 domain-containing protein [Stellaceae bacterium]
MKARSLVLALLVACVLGADSAAIRAAAEPAQPPVVVELFTSQGCNSCPPADEFLGELAKRPDILALAFHVDYWNYIGWTDPFGKPWATGRQRDYQESMHLRYVYTPEMVVNGAAEGVGSDKGAIEALISAAQAKPAPHPTLALHWLADGSLAVDVGEGQSPPDMPAAIWLVGFDQPHSTPVLRGENSGKTLTDYQAVRSYRRIGAWAGWSMEVIVPPDQAKALGDGGVAVLLQAQGTGPILTAARIGLPGG